MTADALNSTRVTKASQDGSREFISVLACISANGRTLPPALIYQADSGDLMDTWLEDWVADQQAFFGSSANGWSSNAFGLDWLRNVFERSTASIAGNKRRLLLVDGHNSHVNLQFVKECDKLRIILIILPPHSTHRLQPLDVGLFSPLSKRYTNELNMLMFNSLGLISMSKRVFWRLFWPAWQQAFTLINIESAWKTTGFFPFHPPAVLDKIIKPAPATPAASTNIIQTPMTCRAIRRAHRELKIKPTKLLMSKILRANEKLSALHSIDQHVIEGLQMAIKDEKKRRRRGKRLKLVGAEESGPQFFSPGKVQAARDYQASKDQEEELRKQGIADRKALAAARKIKKEKERVKRAAITAGKRKMAAEVRAIKEAEKRARAAAKEEASRQKEQQLRLRGQSTVAKEARKIPKKQARRSIGVMKVQEVEVAVVATSRGRQVQKPRRYYI